MGRIEERRERLRDGVEVVIRTAEASDAAAWVEQHRHMHGTSEYLVTQSDEPVRGVEETAAWLEKTLESGQDVAIVAEHGGELVGTLNFHASSRRRIAHHGQFGVGVSEGWRGRGVGRALIGSLLDWAAAHPVIEKVTLGVMDSNAGARRLYRRMGFRAECRQRRYFKLGDGRYADDVVMSLYVKPGVAPAGFATWRVDRSRARDSV